MKYTFTLFLGVLLYVLAVKGQSAPTVDATAGHTISVDPGFDTLVWSDEFDSNGAIDASKWFHQTKLPNGGSWYNGEIQHYTNRTDNAFVENGLLKIVAKKETFTDQGFTKQYTSARLNSKFAFTYGRVEIRAKMPTGIGTWPAMWMLGKNITEDGAYWQAQGFGTTPWPNCGEIDILEHWGTNQDFIQSATHTPSSFGNTNNKGGQTVAGASTGFHVYAVEWSAEKLVFSVDDVVHYTYNPTVKNASTWPFDAEQYLLLNVAILPSITSNFSSSNLEIDYVRVYQQNTLSNTAVSQKTDTIAYPNPVTNKLKINLVAARDQETSLKLYSIEGKHIRTYSKVIKNGSITIDDLSDLPQGIYLVKFVVNEKSQVIKFLKK